SLRDLAYTLQVGREGMDERLGVLASTLEELVGKLREYVKRGDEASEVYRGQVKRTREGLVLISQDEDMREAVSKWVLRKKYTKLLELWVQGLEVPWSQLYGSDRPRLMSLPAYPFANDRYWVQVPPAEERQVSNVGGQGVPSSAAKAVGGGIARLHP